MARLYLVDTNVVVSGVVGPDAQSPPTLIVDAMLEGRLAFVISADLLGEYRRVLTRPSIAKRHGMSASEIDEMLAKITTASYLRQPPPGSPVDAGVDPNDPPREAPPGDAHLVRLLAHEPHAALVCGDQALLDALRGWREVLTPAELVAHELGAR